MRLFRNRAQGIALVLVGGSLLLAAVQAVDLSTPEKTIENYYRGYQTGNKALVEATQIHGPPMSDLGLGDEITYKILEKKLFLYSTHYSVKPGDIEIKVWAEWRRRRPPTMEETMVTTFILGQYGKEWKIKDWYSVHPDVGDWGSGLNR
jgi:hypothetical protein